MNQEKEKNKSVLFGLILLLVALFAPASRGQVTNLGKLTITTGIAWDKNAEPDIAGYYVYARPSNNAAAIYRVPTLTNQMGRSGSHWDECEWQLHHLSHGSEHSRARERSQHRSGSDLRANEYRSAEQPAVLPDHGGTNLIPLQALK
jgi:hypothetical protein